VRLRHHPGQALGPRRCWPLPAGTPVADSNRDATLRFAHPPGRRLRRAAPRPRRRPPATVGRTRRRRGSHRDGRGRRATGVPGRGLGLVPHRALVRARRRRGVHAGRPDRGRRRRLGHRWLPLRAPAVRRRLDVAGDRPVRRRDRRRRRRRGRRHRGRAARLRPRSLGRLSRRVSPRLRADLRGSDRCLVAPAPPRRPAPAPRRRGQGRDRLEVFRQDDRLRNDERFSQGVRWGGAIRLSITSPEFK
jgi:hypothetical protein